MDRRSFVTNLLAGAAAIVGAGMVAPKAEASEGTYLPSGDVHLASYWRGWDDAFTHQTAFDAMQADCEARGCVMLIASDVAQSNGASAHHFAHGPGNHEVALRHMSLLAGRSDDWTVSQVDAWRTSLHRVEAA